MVAEPVGGATLLAALAFAAAAWLALAASAPRPSPVARLARYVHAGAFPQPPSASASRRLGAALVRSLVGLLGSTAPARIRERAVHDLAAAGRPVSEHTYLALRGASLFGLPLLVVVQISGRVPTTALQWLLIVFAIFLGRRLPGIWLKRRIRARQLAVDRAFPFALDLMVACLEAGLSLDAALAKVAEQSEGPLAGELRLVQHQVALGRPTADALRALGDRVGSQDLRVFSRSLVQAERLGTPLATTMRTLAHESRVRRRQRAEEMARKAPVKMIPVLILFILPALLVVVLAPAGLAIARMFAEHH